MIAATPIARFSIGDPLPIGQTTLIEASAGTGKTYALAALTVRFVAERAVPISRILLVTFTRVATAELRDRIRRGLVDAARHLADPGPVDDSVLSLLATCDPAERDRRRQRLEEAVRDFDTVSISTIHGFCSQVRASLGVLSPENIDAVPSESEAELISQVCGDLLFRELDGAAAGHVDGQTVSSLAKLVAKARTLTECDIQAESQHANDLRTAALVREAVEEVSNRLRRTGGLSYDSLLLSVRDEVRRSPTQVEDLRRQFDVALVDEFQDTDPVQWEIFRTVFGQDDGSASLILVGDPKQAVYAFRGGDVYTYLRAKETAQPLALSTNQRSDPAVIDAMNALGAGQAFGEPGIAYQPVEPAERHRERRFSQQDDVTAPGMIVRCLVDPESIGRPKLDTTSVRRRIAADVADIAADLIGHSRVHLPGSDPTPVTPGMIAVLVGSTADAPALAEALRKRGVPVVLRLKDDVAGTEAASQWRTLLHALDRPASTTRATAAALTWFFGWSPQHVAMAMDASSVPNTSTADGDAAARALVELQHLLVEWNELLEAKGMAALLGTARRSHKMVSRLLAADLGERNLTDLEHLAELVHSEARNHGRGVTAATAMSILDGLASAATDEVAADAAQRRIESDAEAVQIMTIHGAKGLQFPVVLLPTLWSGGKRVQAGSPLSFYDATIAKRVLDVSSAQPETDDQKKKTLEQVAPTAYGEARRQNCGDQHRLTYVAMTRAIHQSVVWWSPVGQGSALTGLARLLFGAASDLAADQKADLPKPATETVDRLGKRLEELGATSTVQVDEVIAAASSTPTSAAQGAPDSPSELVIASLGRDLQRAARYWSFTSIKAQMDAGAPAIRLADPGEEFGEDRWAADEDIAPAAVDARHPNPAGAGMAASAGWHAPSPFEGLGGGAEFGNLVHDLFEHTDFRADNLKAEFSTLLAAASTHDVTDAQRLALPSALADVVLTPLGRAFGGIRLCDLDASDRLNELHFYLPLAPGRPVSAGRIGEVVADHLDRADPLHQWAHHLASGLADVDLQGYLNGSIDLTLRFELDGVARYSVVDYKTNNLTPKGTPASLWHYHPDRLGPAMAESHYALQAVIYTVALHRYLRWRLADYDPSVHLGPVGYLYVRGLVGAGTPVSGSGPNAGAPAGVFTWEIPAGLVEAVSDLFAGDDEGGGGP